MNKRIKKKHGVRAVTYKGIEVFQYYKSKEIVITQYGHIVYVDGLLNKRLSKRALKQEAKDYLKFKEQFFKAIDDGKTIDFCIVDELEPEKIGDCITKETGKGLEVEITNITEKGFKDLKEVSERAIESMEEFSKLARDGIEKEQAEEEEPETVEELIEGLPETEPGRPLQGLFKKIKEKIRRIKEKYITK